MSVALSQREVIRDAFGRLVSTPEDKRQGSAIGRFCLNHKPKPLADWLYESGLEYDRIIYEFRKAICAKTISQAKDPLSVPGPFSESAIQELAQKRWNEARDVLDRVDRQAAAMLECVCHEEHDPPSDWAAVLVRGLVALSAHLKLTPPSIHDPRYEDEKIT